MSHRRPSDVFQSTVSPPRGCDASTCLTPHCRRTRRRHPPHRERSRRARHARAHRHGVAVTVQPYLQELHLRTRGQAAWYATVHAGELLLVGAAFGRAYAQPMAKSWFPNMAKLGASRVLLAAGMIEVAHQPEPAEGILRARLRPLTRHPVIDTNRLRRRLLEARDTGYGQEVEQAELGVGCMAAAIRDSSGRLLGAIGVTGRRSHPAAQGAAAVRGTAPARSRPSGARGRRSCGTPQCWISAAESVHLARQRAGRRTAQTTATPVASSDVGSGDLRQPYHRAVRRSCGEANAVWML